jgi:hypothetical protein
MTLYNPSDVGTLSNDSNSITTDFPTCVYMKCFQCLEPYHPLSNIMNLFMGQTILVALLGIKRS